MKILLAEDEASIREHVAQALRSAGYLVVETSDGPTTWETGGTEDFSAIILDLGLPGLDGLTLLKRWRNEGVDTPVLVLTARGSWMERVDGFDSGADDYLPKPFRSEELLARLRALLRRSSRQAGETMAFGRIAIDRRMVQVTLDGAPVAMTPSEFRAVERLMREPGAIVSASEMAIAMQGEETDHSRNAVEVIVTRLRRKLGKDLICTRRGFGYFLTDDTR